MPFKFSYHFECDDPKCKGTHRMMLEDWELGALFWRLRDGGDGPEEAAAKVRTKFLDEICGPQNDRYFYVGTHSVFPSWMVIGLFYPKRAAGKGKQSGSPRLFD